MKRSIYFIVLDFTITGGVERVASNFAKYFASNDNYQFTIISVFKKNSCPAYHLPDSVKVKYLIGNGFYDGRNIKRKIQSNWKMMRAFSKLSFSKNDVVISNMAGCSDFMCFYRKKNNGKLICFEHTYHGVFNKFSTLVKRILFKRADCIVTLTKSEREYYAKIATLAVCIPNALTYAPPIGEEVVRKKRVISAGRLSWEKGYFNLLDNYAVLANKNRNFDFVIFGSGDLKKELEEKVSSMPSNVKLYDSTPKLKEELLSSYLFVSSSTTEAFPMVMLEAMACGLPIVSFDCPCGPREIIEDGKNGKLIKTGDNEAFINAVQKYIDDSALWSCSSSFSVELSKQYLPELIYKQWIDLLEDLN